MADLDGTLTGLAGTTLISNRDMMRTIADTVHTPGAFAYISPFKFGRLVVNTTPTTPAVPDPDIYITRKLFDANDNGLIDAGEGDVTYQHVYTFDPYKQIPVIVDSGLNRPVPEYWLSWPTVPTTQVPIDVTMDDLAVGDTVYLRFEGIANKTNLGFEEITDPDNPVTLVPKSFGRLLADNVTGVSVDTGANLVWIKFVNTSLKNVVQIDWDNP